MKTILRLCGLAIFASAVSICLAQKSNYMQVLADFKTRGVEITTVDEKNAAKPEKKKHEKVEKVETGEETASDDN